DANAEQRERAREFVKGMIAFAAEFGAPAIIGSMQGRWGGDVERKAGMGHLMEAVIDGARHAKKSGTVLLLEPLNRYETNFVTNVEVGMQILKMHGPHV